MSTIPQTDKYSESGFPLSPLQRAAFAVKHLRARLTAAEQAKTEPIAVIGMACRFPGGADTPEAFWRILHDGVDTVCDIPPERWNVNDWFDANYDTPVPGRMYTRQGAFIRQVDQFDPHFFGISAREATGMDPQQRLLLEMCWESLEYAGIAPAGLKGSATGVFMGICFTDYSQYSVNSGDFSRIDAYNLLGASSSVAVGRIAYVLDLQGPVMQVDTTCSSSHLAIHLACQSLRQRECRQALAGGIQLMLSPAATIGFCRMKALSPDGRCKTFDASANGYGRGEGGGVLVLRRLSDALAEGDNILALIRGSAVNHDGSSSGLTVPNGLAQEAVIRQALANAGVPPNGVDYVEAHGTGTSLGDPIELASLEAVLCQERDSKKPLLVGSVKTNLGHLEAGAGIASVMKVVLALQQGLIPPHLHFKTPNPLVDWHTLPIHIPTRPQPWPITDHPRLAGVSGFSMSGTNVHLVLEGYEVKGAEGGKVQGAGDRCKGVGGRKQEAGGEGQEGEGDQFEVNLSRPWHVLTLSGHTPEALRALVRRYANSLANQPHLSLAHVCHTANTGRNHFKYRQAWVADSLSGLHEQLEGWTRHQALFPAATPPPRVAFVFGGGMEAGGRRPEVGSMVSSFDSGFELYQTHPDFKAILDHCRGMAEALIGISLTEWLFFRQKETAIPQEESRKEQVGRQLALFAVAYALSEVWRSWGVVPAVVFGQGVGAVTAACVAGVFSVDDALNLIAARARLASGAPEDQANWSQVIQNLVFSRPRIAIISEHSGSIAGDELLTAAYWQPQPSIKQFDIMGVLAQQDCHIRLNVLAPPTAPGGKAPDIQSTTSVVQISCRADWPSTLEALGQLYVQGVDPDWQAFDQPYSGNRRRIPLPRYPFQRQRYWAKQPACFSVSAPSDSDHNEALLETSRVETSPVMELLDQKDTAQLARLLKARGNLSPEQQALVPAILNLLAEVHHSPPYEPRKHGTDSTALTNHQAARSPWLESLKAMSAVERRELLVARIQAETAGVLEEDRLPNTDLGFFDMGLDSLMAVELKNRLERLMGQPLPATLAFEYPTITAVADFLLNQLCSPQDSEDSDAVVQECNTSEWKLSRQLEALSEDETEALLLKKLAAL